MTKCETVRSHGATTTATSPGSGCFCRRRRRAQGRRANATECEMVTTGDTESDGNLECETRDERGRKLEILHRCISSMRQQHGVPLDDRIVSYLQMAGLYYLARGVHDHAPGCGIPVRAPDRRGNGDDGGSDDSHRGGGGGAGGGGYNDRSGGGGGLGGLGGHHGGGGGFGDGGFRGDIGHGQPGR
nr:pupal cuticle protein 36-like [Arachis hypogaea]